MRLDHLRNYLFLMGTFRNGSRLVRALREDTVCHEAIEWNGTRLVHPKRRAGFVGTLIELWRERCYTRDGFYSPTRGDVIIDAGAHVGLFSIWMARKEPGAKIIALEPNAENYPCLQRNLKAAAADNVEAYQVAVGGVAGFGVVRPCTDRSIDHRLVKTEATNADAIPTVTLRRLTEMVASERVAFLKMDIEGAEHDAFMTADRSTLERFDRIAMEYHDNLVPDTLALVTDRLAATHQVTVHPTADRGYGMLYAVRRAGAV